jgi:hypothetical protein
VRRERDENGVRRTELHLPTGAVLHLVRVADLGDPERRSFEALWTELAEVTRGVDRAELEALLVLARAATGRSR